MKYISTRGQYKGRCNSADAIKCGIADDGGLFMPEDIPSLSKDELCTLIRKNYAERAAFVIGKFLTDYTYEELLCNAKEAYSEEKFGSSPAPVCKIDEKIYTLELWHGPTSAFKDIALQIMPRLFVRALKKTGESREALILVATSGDTGKAALEGYRDVRGTKIQVFYPTYGVSCVQKLQMQTQEGENVSVKGIRGNFDDAQSAVKRIFANAEFAATLDEKNVFLSSANSINWGRLVPQIVYYVSAYLDMVTLGEIELGDVIDVCVPTGNFGNILACYIAKLMGLPVGTLVCASNSNNVLTDFLESGTYDKNREFHATISPSMDILISSNLERLLYLVSGKQKTAEYMSSLTACGKYTVSPEELSAIRQSFVGIFADESETLETIARTYKNKNYLIDTHTAVAMCAAEKYMDIHKAERKVLVVSTASPYKFAKDVYFALDNSNVPTDTEALAMLSELTGTEIPTPLSSVLGKKILHSDVIGKEAMDSAVLNFVCD